MEILILLGTPASESREACKLLGGLLLVYYISNIIGFRKTPRSRVGNYN